MPSFGRRQDGQCYEPGDSKVGLAIQSVRTQESFTLELVELSPGGLKFRGPLPEGALAKRESVQATITWEARRVTLSGEVAWLRGDGDVEGGIRFDSLTHEERDRLAGLVALLQLGTPE